MYTQLFCRKKKLSIKRLRIFPSNKAKDQLEDVAGLEIKKLFHFYFAKYSQNLNRFYLLQLNFHQLSFLHPSLKLPPLWPSTLLPCATYGHVPSPQQNGVETMTHVSWHS